jgi:hypothetical protein
LSEIGVLEMFCKNDNLITMPSKEISFSYEQMNIISGSQRSWTQLAVYLGKFINDSVYGLPSADDISIRLFQVPADFRDTFLLFYGPEVGNRVGGYFTNFIAKATNVVEGYKSGNIDMVNQGTQQWYNISNELARFLSSINIFWDEGQWKNLFYQYIQLKLDTIIAILSGDYQREILIYDKLFDLTNIMGTFMATGLITHDIQTAGFQQF